MASTLDYGNLNEWKENSLGRLQYLAYSLAVCIFHEWMKKRPPSYYCITATNQLLALEGLEARRAPPEVGVTAELQKPRRGQGQLSQGLAVRSLEAAGSRCAKERLG